MPSEKGSDGRIPLTEYLGAYDPHVRTLIREIRKVARAAAPVVEEKAYRGWGLWLIGERGEIVVAGARDHARVRVRASAADDDRSGLLRGSGKTSRYVPVGTIAEARGEALRDLIRRQLASGPVRLTLQEGKGKQVLERVRQICLALRGTSERLSHGTPTFFTRGKQFAQVWAGHHDDHGLQLWCAAPSGAQTALAKADPDRFFVPPYVGHRGWLGVRLERNVDWRELGRILQDAHTEVAGG